MARTSTSPPAGKPPAEPSRALNGLLAPVAEAVSHAVAREVSRWTAGTRTKTFGAKRYGARQDPQQTVEKDLQVNLTAITTTALVEALRALSPSQCLALFGQLLGVETDGLAPETIGKGGRSVLTTDEVAALLKVSRPYVAMLCDAGKLGAVMMTEGGYRRISASGVAAYLAERAKGAGRSTPREAGVAAGLYEHADTYYTDAGHSLTKPSGGAKSRAARSRGTVAK